MTTYDTLIDAPTLQTLFTSQTKLSVFDVSFDLANPAAGRAQFEGGHIAGARHLHLDDDLSGPKAGVGVSSNVCGGRHPLPSREELACRLSAWGISNDSQVIVYDRSPAPFTGMFAVRLWGLLRWAGHRAVAVLDGGFAAWQADGGAVTVDAAAAVASAAAFELQEPLLQVVTADEVQAAIGRPTHRLVDARLADRFTGAVEPMDPVAGHIPGALNRFFGQNIQASGMQAGRFKPAQELKAQFEALLGSTPANQVVHQCGSGVTALHNLLAMEVAGLHGSALYAGSWSEWCSVPERPVARGG